MYKDTDFQAYLDEIDKSRKDGYKLITSLGGTGLLGENFTYNLADGLITNVAVISRDINKSSALLMDIANAVAASRAKVNPRLLGLSEPGYKVLSPEIAKYAGKKIIESGHFKFKTVRDVLKKDFHDMNVIGFSVYDEEKTKAILRRTDILNCSIGGLPAVEKGPELKDLSNSLIDRDFSLETNVKIILSISPLLKEINREALVIMTATPEAECAEIFRRESGLSPQKIIMIGGLLDSNRARSRIGAIFDEPIENISNVQVVGNHGDGSVGNRVVPLFDKVEIDGMSYYEYFMENLEGNGRGYSLNIRRVEEEFDAECSKGISANDRLMKVADYLTTKEVTEKLPLIPKYIVEGTKRSTKFGPFSTQELVKGLISYALNARDGNAGRVESLGVYLPKNFNNCGTTEDVYLTHPAIITEGGSSLYNVKNYSSIAKQYLKEGQEKITASLEKLDKKMDILREESQREFANNRELTKNKRVPAL